MLGPFAPIPIETFGGLCDAVDRNDLPPFMAWKADNCSWKPGSLAKRPGFTQWFEMVGYSVRGLFAWPSMTTPANPSGREVVVACAQGFAGRKADGSALWTFGAADHASDAAVVCSAVRAYGDLGVTLSDGRRGVSWGGFFRYVDSTLGSWPAFLKFYLEPPPVALTLSQVVGGGNMTAGTHTVWATFELPDGAMTPPTPPASITINSNDGIRATFASVNSSSPQLEKIRAVWIWCSPAGDTQNGYVTKKCALADLPVTITDVDGVLTTAEKMDWNALARTSAPFMPAAAFGTYKGRVCYVGAPHRYYPGSRATGRSLNTTFEYAGATLPGWSTPAAGGNPSPRVYSIVFDGSSSSRGLLSNTGTVVEDLAGRCTKGATTFSNARWSVRVLARRSAGLANASLRFGATGSSGSWSVDIASSQIGTRWTLLEAAAAGTSWSNDLKLFVEGIGPGVNLEAIDVCLVEAFDHGSRLQDETVWWSRPAKGREVDMTNGPVTIDSGSGQKIRYGFELGGRWFYVLDKSIWATADNEGEPKDWPVEKVADGVGTPSFQGADVNGDWAVVAGPAGLWLFTGGPLAEDNELSREIRGREGTKGTWDRIAWEAYGHLVWVRVLEHLKQIWIGVPLDGATSVSHILVLDYSEGFGSGLSSGGVGRRWSVWSVSSAARALEFRDVADQNLVLLAQSGKVIQRDESTHDDLGAGVPWEWQSGPTGQADGALSLFRQLLVSAEGSGTLGLSLVKASSELVQLISPTLYSPRRADQRVLLSLSDERVAVRLYQTATVGTWARVNRVALSAMRRPLAPYRPVNP